MTHAEADDASLVSHPGPRDIRSERRSELDVDPPQVIRRPQEKSRAATSIKRPSEADSAVAQLHQVDAADADSSLEREVRLAH